MLEEADPWAFRAPFQRASVCYLLFLMEHILTLHFSSLAIY